MSVQLFSRSLGGWGRSPDQAPEKFSRLESATFFVFLGTIILTPLAFLPTPYIALEAVKSLVVVVGALISAILCGLIVFRERSVVLPPKIILWPSLLVALSVFASSIISSHFSKSFFGQGFELGTASMLLALFVTALVGFVLVRRRPERAMAIYAAIAGTFLVLALFHFIRLGVNPASLTLGILQNRATTIFGNWFSLGIGSIAVLILSVCALEFLPLTRKAQIIYGSLGVVAAVFAFIVNDMLAWWIAAIVFIALVKYIFYFGRPKHGTEGRKSYLSRIAVIPLLALALSLILAIWGQILAGPVVNKLEASYLDISLPWQMTLDVASNALKVDPLFGIGPNRFGRAFIAYKPPVINQTIAWSAEFNYGFGLIPTFAVTQGFLGIVAWLAFLVALAASAWKVLSRLPEDPYARFIIVSSAAAALFLWLTALVYVPSHAILLYAFVLLGVFFGAAAAYGLAAPFVLDSASRPGRTVVTVGVSVLMLVGLVWGINSLRSFTALAYFGSGVKSLTAASDPIAADKAFQTSCTVFFSDSCLRGRIEAQIQQAQALIVGIPATASASTSQATISQATDLVNQALANAKSAVQYDPTDYYNPLAEARVSTFAANIRMADAYDNAVRAYTDAIKLNPLNPTLYVGLAQFQASQNKLAEALQTAGAAVQVKNDNLDAIFLISQIEAALGNLPNAIIAAKVATQINPQNAILFFQLGLLEYQNKQYAAAATDLASAVKLQPDYANAQYFLGLSYAALGQTAEAVAQFEALAISNPDNQEVALILANMKAGRSPFSNAKPPVTPTPEKRSTLPLKETVR